MTRKQFSNIVFGLVCLLCSVVTVNAQEPVQVPNAAIADGYFVKKVWLKYHQVPTMRITEPVYRPLGQADKEVSVPEQTTPSVSLGMEQKKTFAIIKVPAFRRTPQGVERLTSFQLNVEEATLPNARQAQKPTTDIAASVLATGSWHKFAITQTGVHRLDYNFFISAGFKPTDLVSANLRVVGNGGRMLPEANFVPVIEDLKQNAIMVIDGGDNVINEGDYVLFYGVGTLAIVPDSAKKQFTHRTNLYTDTAYYFMSFSSGLGLRIPGQVPVPTSNVTSTGFNYFDVYERELINPTGYGKTWYGESFYTDAGTNNQTFSFDLGDVVSNVSGYVALSTNQSASGSTYTVSANGTPVKTTTAFLGTGGSKLMTHPHSSWTATVNSRTVAVGISFTPSFANPEARGFLNYITINCRRTLNVTGSQLSFRDWETVGAGKVARYDLQNANPNTMVWDVTDPQLPIMMAGSLAGATYSFSQDASTLHEFVAVNNASLPTPKYVGPVANQNLHGTGQVDYVVVTYPQYLNAAQRIADFHRQRSKMRVVVATTEQVYNEFSSGAQDISAIRNFARMFYRRAGNDSMQMPKNLLLLGSASYDYKNRLTNNTNQVPTFEAACDSDDIGAYLSDDFFGFLDESENSDDYTIVNAMDIGVGRLPARTLEEAEAVVDKCMHYKDPETLGPWRTNTMLVADDNDGAGMHMLDADSQYFAINETTSNEYNFQKVYLNGITPVSTPAGTRSPAANAAINGQIFKGVFLVNYSGHGNPQVWAGERILTQDDFNKWNNARMLPFMVTATCDFGQYDHPQYVSAAEKMLLRSGGGAIAMVTTTGPVYSFYNTPMNMDYVTAQFEKNSDGGRNSFGEACRRGKNKAYVGARGDFGKVANYRKFVLLGDPALTPNFPEHVVAFDSLIDGATQQVSDTIKALGKYVIKGSVRNHSGAVLKDFSGNMFVSVYDKARNITVNSFEGRTHTYQMQDNLVYKGKVSVQNGTFTLTFITPKDINYLLGSGKLSGYADNDSAGADTSLVVGGFSDNPVLSATPPVVRPYIGDSMFINGGITGQTTSLFVKFESETGINVSGYSLGHDLTAVLDGDAENPYVLNDYYETAPNTYQVGYARFPISGLSNGRHRIVVKAWDVNNNTGTGTVDFVVVDGAVVAIDNLGNYPNPFSTNTHFVYEHNHPEEQLDVAINIYNTAGTLVRELRETIQPSGSRTADVMWDGSDNGGNPLPSGVYVYKLNIKTDKGYTNTAYQKLVIVR
jgi:hypothetical protein